MAITSIGNGSGSPVGAEFIQNLALSLAAQIGAGQRTISDVASVLLSEVATSDISKLSKILDPAPDHNGNQVLDSLLNSAVQELARGNGERAVGYLADIAARDPRRAETLPFQPELEPVRDKIDTMVSRMTVVAKIAAENGLSHAEQVSTDLAGKLVNWDTHADVLLRVAHHLFEAGGYANYSRTAELAKVVSDSVSATKPNDQVLAAAASAFTTAVSAPNQIVPGLTVPYWASPDFPQNSLDSRLRAKLHRDASPDAFGDFGRSLKELKEISMAVLREIWDRAPLLVLMLAWLFVGVTGGVAFAIGIRVWPESPLIALGNFGFQVWGIGFLALICFGFYVRIRDRRDY
jgi:hypothetical protein